MCPSNMNRTKRVKYDPSALALSRKDLSVALICFDVRPKVLCFKPLLFFSHSFSSISLNFEAFEEKMLIRNVAFSFDM